MKDFELSLGKRVRFTQHLDRRKEGNQRVWEPRVLVGEGTREWIVIGLRTLQNGRMESDSDPEAPEYGVSYFACIESFPAALISTNLYRKPVLVALDDLQPCE